MANSKPSWAVTLHSWSYDNQSPKFSKRSLFKLKELDCTQKIVYFTWEGYPHILHKIIFLNWQ